MSLARTLARITKDEKKRQDGTLEEGRKYDPQKQAEGISERLEASGIDAEKEKDKRNFIEKGLNLKEDQNILFDFFEVVGRPQQALFGGIEGTLSGDGFGEGALAGFTGNKDTKFKDVLNEAGITEETEGKLGLDDILGFAGDVMIDPMSWAFMPAKGLKSSIKAVDEAKDAVVLAQHGLEAAEAAMKVKQAGQVVQGAEQAVNSGAALAQATKGLDEASDAFKAAETAFNLLPKKRRTLQSMVMSGLGSGFKGAYTVADSGITGVLTWAAQPSITEATLKGIDPLEVKNALNMYNGLKESLNATFNIAASIPKDLMNKVRNLRGKQSYTNAKMLKDLNITNGTFNELVPAIAQKNGMQPDEVWEFLGIVYERGNVLYDETGKVTMKGMQQTTTLKRVVTDEAFLERMGVTKDTATQLEAVIQDFFPQWYQENIVDAVNESTGAAGKGIDLFHVTEASDGIQETYRIASPELRESLSEMISNVDPDSVIEGAVNPNYTDHKAGKDLIAVRKDRKDLNDLAIKNKNGKVIPRGNEEAVKQSRVLNNNVDTAKINQNKATAEVERTFKLKGRKGHKQAGRDLLKAEEDFIRAKLEYMTHINTHSVPIKDAIKLLDAKEAAIYKAFPGINVTSGQEVMDKLNKNFEIPHYFSEDKIKKLEGFAQTPEVGEAMAAIHDFYGKAGKDLTEIMESGIVLSDGYMPHVLNPEWAQAKINRYASNSQSTSVKNKLSGGQQFIGNTKTMQGRAYKSSAVEANDLAKGYLGWLKDTGGFSDEIVEKLDKAEMIDMFSTDIRKSLVDFADKTTQASADAAIFNEVLMSALVRDDKGNYGSYIRIKEGNEKIPRGFVELSVNDLEEKTKALARFLGDDQFKKAQEAMGSFFKDNHGKFIYMDKNVERLIKISSRTQEANHMLGFMDSLNNIFKSNKLLSPGFQMRNLVGNTSNMILSGVPMKDAVGGMFKASKTLKNGEKLMDMVAAGEVLNKVQAKQLEDFVEFAKHGFVDYGNALHDIPEEMLNRKRESNAYGKHLKQVKSDEEYLSLVKKGAISEDPNRVMATLDSQSAAAAPGHAMNKLKEFNMDKNQEMDLIARMTLWNYAKDNPQWLVENGYESADSAVRMIMFDFQDLTVNEQDYLKKIIPFYTFTKKNLGFQIQNLGKNTHKYNNMIKAFNSAWDVLDLEDEERDMYKIENFWIPLPRMKEDGTYYAIKSSLPIGDLGEFLETPLKRVMSSTAPIVRAPFEMAMNKQVFSDMAISNYKGEKGFYIPEMTKKQEYGLSQLGLDVPASAAFDIGRAVSNVAKGETNNPLTFLEESVGRTLVSKGDRHKTAERKGYDNLDNMQNALRAYKQKGIDIKTLAEINNSKKLKGTQNIIRQLQGMRRK